LELLFDFGVLLQQKSLLLAKLIEEVFHFGLLPFVVAKSRAAGWTATRVHED